MINMENLCDYGTKIFEPQIINSFILVSSISARMVYCKEKEYVHGEIVCVTVPVIN